MARANLAGDFSLLDYRFRDGFGRRLECQHPGEYFHVNGQTLSTTGLGAVVSGAADQGSYPVLLVATILMAIIVLTINRLVWRRLYTLASTKFKLEM